MTTLGVDIKANNEFEASAYATADALQKIAGYETKIDAINKNIAGSYAKGASAAVAMAKSQTKIVGQEYKGLAVEKKKTSEGFKFTDAAKKASVAIAAVTAATVAAAAAAVTLGYKIADAAKTSFEARKEAGALLNAWTGQRGPRAMQLIDQLAGQLGMRFTEARDKFLQFREAGLNNKMAAQLLKLRADLIATGLSAESADKEISRVTSVGGDVYARARALAELQTAYKGVGSGALAAQYATQSLEGAQAKLANAFDTTMADLWKEIGPSIGAAAHQVADFALALLKSDEGQAAIGAVASAFKALPGYVAFVLDYLKEHKNDFADFFSGAVTVVKVFAAIVGTVAEYTVKAFAKYGEGIGLLASDVVNGVEWITDAITSALDIADELYETGANIVRGLVDGIASGFTAAGEAASALAQSVYQPFAKALGIESPSKLFAEYGRNTVAGFELGERQELGGRDMPLQEAASVQPMAPRALPGGGESSAAAVAPMQINIEIHAPPGADLEYYRRTIRQEIQLLLQAGNLSRGVA